MSNRTVWVRNGRPTSRKSAAKLLKRGRARLLPDGSIEIIADLAPSELNRQLQILPIPKVQHSPALFVKALHHANATNQHAVDLLTALPVSPEWLKKMGYR